MTAKSLSYRNAGVDIDAGEELVKRIKPAVAKTQRPGVLGQLGGFGALFELPWQQYRQPVLVSSTDGVGTKLKLALASDQHQNVGIDLVAMCANDLVVCGAEPLFFLDYYATAKLDVETATTVINSIANGCQQAGMALIGGETAEMPGMYHDGDYDLAGFCVGIVEKDRVIDGQQVAPGDRLIALGSSGVHSNGFSLIRKILARSQSQLSDPFVNSNDTFADVLLTPTRIYVKPLLELRQRVSLKAIAHITGGGLLENIPRVLPPGVQARIDTQSWQHPAIFDWLQQQGNLSDEEMWRTFNCGIGMLICVAADDVDTTLAQLRAAGENAWCCGEIARSNTDQAIQMLP